MKAALLVIVALTAMSMPACHGFGGAGNITTRRPTVRRTRRPHAAYRSRTPTVKWTHRPAAVYTRRPTHQPYGHGTSGNGNSTSSGSSANYCQRCQQKHTLQQCSSIGACSCSYPAKCANCIASGITSLTECESYGFDCTRSCGGSSGNSGNSGGGSSGNSGNSGGGSSGNSGNSGGSHPTPHSTRRPTRPTPRPTPPTRHPTQAHPACVVGNPSSGCTCSPASKGYYCHNAKTCVSAATWAYYLRAGKLTAHCGALGGNAATSNAATAAANAKKGLAWETKPGYMCPTNMRLGNDPTMQQPPFSKANCGNSATLALREAFNACGRYNTQDCGDQDQRPHPTHLKGWQSKYGRLNRWKGAFNSWMRTCEQNHCTGVWDSGSNGRAGSPPVGPFYVCGWRETTLPSDNRARKYSTAAYISKMNGPAGSIVHRNGTFYGFRTSKNPFGANSGGLTTTQSSFSGHSGS